MDKDGKRGEGLGMADNGANFLLALAEQAIDAARNDGGGFFACRIGSMDGSYYEGDPGKACQNIVKELEPEIEQLAQGLEDARH